MKSEKGLLQLAADFKAAGEDVAIAQAEGRA